MKLPHIKLNCWLKTMSDSRLIFALFRVVLVLLGSEPLILTLSGMFNSVMLWACLRFARFEKLCTTEKLLLRLVSALGLMNVYLCMGFTLPYLCELTDGLRRLASFCVCRYGSWRVWSSGWDPFFFKMWFASTIFTVSSLIVWKLTLLSSLVVFARTFISSFSGSIWSLLGRCLSYMVSFIPLSVRWD